MVAGGLEESVAREKKGMWNWWGVCRDRKWQRGWRNLIFCCFHRYPKDLRASDGSDVQRAAVVVPPNSGSVARDGTEGYFAAHDDVEALRDIRAAGGGSEASRKDGREQVTVGVF